MNTTTSDAAELDLIVPVFNEGPNIARSIEEIDAKVPLRKRILIVYDFDEDDTLPAVRAIQPSFPEVQLLKNSYGRGVLNAIRAGIAAATAEVVVITMADLSDDPAIVPRMVEMIRREGFDIVCASRYVRGRAPDRRSPAEEVPLKNGRVQSPLPHRAAHARRNECIPGVSQIGSLGLPDRKHRRIRIFPRGRRSRRSLPAGGSAKSPPPGETAAPGSHGFNFESGFLATCDGTAMPC